MTKILKKIKLSFVAAIAGILGLGTAAGVSSSVTKAEGDPINYVSLGDSVTAGFGFNDYYVDDENPSSYKEDSVHNSVDGFLTKVTQSYPALVADALDGTVDNTVDETYVNWTPLAASSFRIDDIYYELAKGYVGDSGEVVTDYFYDYFFGTTSETTKWNSIFASRALAPSAAKYMYDAVASADIITLNAGLNNFGSFLTTKILNLFELEDSSFLDDLGSIGEFIEDRYYSKNVDSLQGLIDRMGLSLQLEDVYDLVYGAVNTLVGIDLEDYESIAIGDFAKVNVKEAIDVVICSFISYCYYMNETTKLIRKVNPDAQLVVIGMVNPFEGLTLKYNEIVIPAGDIYGYILQAANIYTGLLTDEADHFQFVDAGAYDIPRFTSNLNLEDNLTNEDDQARAFDIVCSFFDFIDLDVLYRDDYDPSDLFNPDAARAEELSYDAIFSVLKVIYKNIQRAVKDNKTVDINQLISNVELVTGGELSLVKFNRALAAGDFDSLLALYVRLGIDNDVWGMPNADGHKIIADLTLDVINDSSKTSARQYMVSRFVDDFGPIINRVISRFNDIFDYVLSIDLRDVYSSVVGSIEAFEDYLTNAVGGGSVSNVMIAVFANIYDRVVGHAVRRAEWEFDSATAYLEYLIRGIADVAVANIGNVTWITENIINGTTWLTEEVITKGFESLINGGDLIIGGMNISNAVALKVAEGIANMIRFESDMLVKFIEVAGWAVRNVVSFDIESTIAYVQDIIIGIYNRLDVVVDSARDIVVSIIEKAADALIACLDYATKAVEEAKKVIAARYAFIQSQFDSAADFVDKVAADIDAFVSARLLEVTNFVSAVLNNNQEVLEEVLADLVAFIDECGRNVVTFVTDSANFVTEVTNNLISAINARVAAINERIHEIGVNVRAVIKNAVESAIYQIQEVAIELLNGIAKLYEIKDALIVSGIEKAEALLVSAVEYIEQLPTEYHSEFSYVVDFYASLDDAQAVIEDAIATACEELYTFISENEFIQEKANEIEEVYSIVELAKALLESAEDLPGTLSEEAIGALKGIIETVADIFPHEYTSIEKDENGNFYAECDVCGWITYDVDVNYSWSYDADAHAYNCHATASVPYSDVKLEEDATVEATIYKLPDIGKRLDGTSRYIASFDIFPQDTLDVTDIIIDYEEEGYISYKWTENSSACTATVKMYRSTDLEGGTNDTFAIDPLVLNGVAEFTVDKEAFTETASMVFEYKLNENDDDDDVVSIPLSAKVRDLSFKDTTVTYNWNDDGTKCIARAELVVNSPKEEDKLYEETVTIADGGIVVDVETGIAYATFKEFNPVQFVYDETMTLSYGDDVTYSWTGVDKCTATVDLLLNGTKISTVTEEAKNIKEVVIKAPQLDVEGSAKYVAEFEKFASTETAPHTLDAITYVKTVGYKWATDGKSVVATVLLSNGEMIEEQGVITSSLNSYETLYEKGSTLYSATFAHADAASTVVVDREKLTIVGNPVYSWTGVDKCSATITLSDGQKIVEEGAIFSTVTKEATLDEAGEMVYTAVFQSVASTTKTVSIPKLELPEGAIRVDSFMTDNGGSVTVDGVTISFDKAAAETIDRSAILYVRISDDQTEIEVVLKNGNFDETFSGEVTITVPYTKTVAEGYLVKVYYVYGDTKVDMNATYANNTITFKTTHFSRYVIEVEKEPDPVDPIDPVDPVDPVDPEPPVEEDTDFTNILFAVSGALGATALVFAFILVAKAGKGKKSK